MNTSINESQLFRKWGKRIAIVESSRGSKLSYDTKRSLAMCLENTREAISLTEATNHSDVQGVKQFAIDLVTAVVPNLVAESIVSVQPITNQVGVVNYIKYIYGSSKGKVTKGDVFASALQENNSDFYYSSEEVDAEVINFDEATKKFSGTLTWLPVLPGSLVIDGTDQTDANNVKLFSIISNPEGKFAVIDRLTGKGLTGVTATGTLDPQSGAFEIVVDGLTPNASDTYTANYHYDQKSIGDGAIGTNALKVPEIELRITALPIQAKSRKLKALYAIDSMMVLQKEYGADIDTLLQTQIAAEIAHEIDGEIMNDLFLQAGMVNEGFSTKLPVGVSKRDHYESFLYTLVKGSNKIFSATKRAQGNFIVAGLNVSSVIEVAVNFRPGNVPEGVVGPHEIGKIGQFRVIKNPYFGDDDYVIGYRGSNLLEAGYIYAPYLPVMSTQMVMADDFVGRKGWMTSYGKKMVNPNLYCRGNITAD